VLCSSLLISTCSTVSAPWTSQLAVSAPPWLAMTSQHLSSLDVTEMAQVPGEDFEIRSYLPTYVCLQMPASLKTYTKHHTSVNDSNCCDVVFNEQ